ncbi:MAG: CBS domain-containing protein [Pirellulaceae bacterium]|nr:CBS domain-containing protein [Pirellulaceae bacterium]
MRVNEILRSKGDSVYQISPTATLAEAVDTLVKFNCGSLLVLNNETVLGIITERDILKAIASQRQSLNNLLVRDFMTQDLITGKPDDEVENIMGVMTSRRVRHLPIMEGERLAGLVSIGDVVKAQYDILTVENHYLKVYIQS